MAKLKSASLLNNTEINVEQAIAPASRRAFLRVREAGVIGVLFFEIILFAWLIHRQQSASGWLFLSSDNLSGIVLDSAVIGIVAVGAAVVIIAGGIDLSVGGVIALASVVVAGMLRAGQPLPLAILAALLAGVLMGASAALLVTVVELPPFIATLALMLIARGLAFVISRGEDWSIGELAPAFTEKFGAGGIYLGLPLRVHILGHSVALGFTLPYLICLLGAVTLLLAFALSRTTWGRQVFAVGGNEVAARYAGVAVHKIQWSVYVLSGLLAALAGVVFAAKYGTGRADTAQGYELDAVAAAVVGGASLSGGRGSVWGAVLGALIFTALRTGMDQITGASTYQNVIIGLVVIAAVVADRLIQKRVAVR